MQEDHSFVHSIRLRDSQHDLISVDIGTSPQNGLWSRSKGSDAPFQQLFATHSASYSPCAEIDGKIYMVTDYEAPNKKLVAFDPAHPEPENWQTIIPEHAKDILDDVFLQQGKLFTSYKHDAADQLKVFTPQGQYQYDVPIPAQSTFDIARCNPDDKDLAISVTNFQQPQAIYKYDIASNSLDLVTPSAAIETLNDCIVERIEAVSKDGTKIPMTVIRHPDTKLDGTAALKLYGYGGFNVPLGPTYSAGIVNWVRAGGIFVQTNLRGGGEFGSEWYEGGRLDNKMNVFDDFAACGEALIQKNYTRSSRMVSAGGSNGGLLTLATMLLYPKLFGAVISSVPVTDMYRFDKHTYGSAWRSDYGNPSNVAKDFETNSKYSPLHTIKPGQMHPPVLVTTGDHDDRVVPSHAYKFIATLLEKHNPACTALLRVDMRAGHGAGKPTAKVIEETADVHAFVETAIGPINQNAYKATLTQRPRRRAGPRP